MEDEDEIVAARPIVKIDAKAYAKTTSLNLISRSSSLSGPQNIVAQGRCVIREQAVLRGDLAKISIGKCCYISKGVSLHPPSNPWVAGFLPLTVGDYVYFGVDCVVKSATIGSCVKIGDGCVLGERCIIRDGCEIAPNSYIPPDTVVAPFSHWSGNPAKLIRVLPESVCKMIEWEAEALFIASSGL